MFRGGALLKGFIWNMTGYIPKHQSIRTVMASHSLCGRARLPTGTRAASGGQSERIHLSALQERTLYISHSCTQAAPAELNIYAVKTIANTNKLDDINAFLKWFFTIEDFQKTKDMMNGIKASPIKEGLKNLTDQCWQAFQNKLYAVCATSLLSVIEGILSEFSDDKQDVVDDKGFTKEGRYSQQQEVQFKNMYGFLITTSSEICIKKAISLPMNLK